MQTFWADNYKFCTSDIQTAQARKKRDV